VTTECIFAGGFQWPAVQLLCMSSCHDIGYFCQMVMAISRLVALELGNDNNNSNNNNKMNDNVYGAVIMTQSLREFTRFI